MLLYNGWLIKELLRPICNLGIFFFLPPGRALLPKVGTEEGSDPAESSAGQSFSYTSSPILHLGRCPLPGVLLFFFSKDFIYLFIDTEKERQRPRQREKQAPCREPDVELDPGSSGSCPRLKAALNHWATGAVRF